MGLQEQVKSNSMYNFDKYPNFIYSALYDKRDDFDIRNVNFPYIGSNIPEA